MTDDLTTLLRDAGREPTIDLDVDAVHTRGRRRAVGRRVAVGAGALALLGVIGAGVATLFDAPDAPIVDQAPSGDGTPEGGEDEGREDGAADQQLAASLGVTTHRLLAEGDQTRIVRATQTSVAGRVMFGGPPLWAAPTVSVTTAGDVWWDDGNGGVWVLPAGDTTTPVEGAASGDDVTWRVLGADGAGEVLLGRFSTADGGERFTIHRSDGDVLGEEFAGLDVLAAIEGDGQPRAATSGPAAPEEVVVLDSIGESYAVTHLPLGGTPRTLMGAGGLDHWLAAVALVGRDVWVLEAGTDGDVDVLIVPLDGEGLARAATPIGREFEGYVLDLTVAEGPSGPVAVLTASTEDGELASWTVDTATVGVAATPSEAMQPGPADVAPGFERIDLPGRVLVTPAPADDGETGPLAACATDEDVALNTPPVEPGSLVYLCWDAIGQLGQGQAHPFVTIDRWAAGDGTIDGDALLSRLGVWAAGPTRLDAARGLSGGVDDDVATFASVTTGGADGLVEIGLDSGPQVGVLGTTTGGATFVQAVVGMVLQYDGFERVRFTLDGSCEDWAAVSETEGCPSYDSSHTPWAQGSAVAADAEATDLEDGRHPVYLEALDVDDRTLTFDVIQWLSGEEARAAHEAETGEPDGPPNDYFIRNENPRLRTLTVADPVDVQLVRLIEDGDAGLDPGTWDELPTYFVPYRSGDLASPGLSWNPFWLTIEDGVIVAIEEQYVP